MKITFKMIIVSMFLLSMTASQIEYFTTIATEPECFIETREEFWTAINDEICNDINDICTEEFNEQCIDLYDEILSWDEPKTIEMYEDTEWGN